MDIHKAMKDQVATVTVQVDDGILTVYRGDQVLGTFEVSEPSPSINANAKDVAQDPQDKITSESEEQMKEGLKKTKEELEKEKTTLSTERDNLLTDINIHQTSMEMAFSALNAMANRERETFINAVVREVELFKLPTFKRLVGTDKLEGLMEEAKKISDDIENFNVDEGARRPDVVRNTFPAA